MLTIVGLVLASRIPPLMVELIWSMLIAFACVLAVLLGYSLEQVMWARWGR